MTSTRGLPAEKVVLEYKDRYSHIYMRSDNIAEVHLFPGIYYGTKVNTVIERIKVMSKTNHLLVLVITHKGSMSTLSGIKAVLSKPGTNYSAAKAYVFQTPVQFFLAHLGKRIYSPQIPIRFFKDRAAAETWLNSFQGYGI
jgi:hypothetical protein